MHGRCTSACFIVVLVPGDLLGSCGRASRWWARACRVLRIHHLLHVMPFCPPLQISSLCHVFCSFCKQMKTQAEVSKARQPEDAPYPDEPKANENPVEQPQKEDVENGGVVKIDAEMEQRAPDDTKAATSGDEMHQHNEEIVHI